MTLCKTALFAGTVIVGLATNAIADQLPVPAGPVLLTLSGELAHETTDGTVTLDLEMLKEMAATVITTSTIWMEEEVEFTGVPLRDLLEYAGAQGSTVGAVALNDYKVDIPADEISATTPIVAYLMDGEEMSPRGKGPLWIVYPYDDSPDYRTEVIYSRSIWQLDRIVSSD
ncbi:molybdopterin-dependent oxidoreductase [uncultured Roseobacter sp.]|uniref:molybdopterin-dependent oxidoreductase n=1 Tax=uncultured Roseobacter sp. TaxID=114847 RepID=UPI00260D362B|nr:molybdopterin-dependent oxidoreductase [uncultured Roseobacter sp.]